MPTLKVFVESRTTDSRGRGLSRPIVEALILYDGKPFPEFGAAKFEFSVDLADPFQQPVWNVRTDGGKIEETDTTELGALPHVRKHR